MRVPRQRVDGRLKVQRSALLPALPRTVIEARRRRQSHLLCDNLPLLCEQAWFDEQRLLATPRGAILSQISVGLRKRRLFSQKVFDRGASDNHGYAGVGLGTEAPSSLELHHELPFLYEHFDPSSGRGTSSRLFR